MTYEVSSVQLGRCRQCRVVHFRMPAGRPVAKFICGVVRKAWRTEIERRAVERTAGGAV